MITRAHSEDTSWFRTLRSQIEGSLVDTTAHSTPPPVPGTYPRLIAVLHPGCHPTGDLLRPFHRDDADDPRLTDAQAHTLERILLDHSGPDTPCTFAVYAGYLDREDRGHHQGFEEPDATWVEGDLWFALFSADAENALFNASARRWEHVQLVELSHVWPRDRSWFLASEPDLAYTVIGCDTGLARKLLAHTELNARPWPEYEQRQAQ